MRRLSTFSIRTLTAAAALQFAALSFAEQASILDLAPRDTAFVVSIENFASMKASFDKTGLRKIWDDPKVQSFIKTHAKEAMDEMVKGLEESGIKADELEAPSGPVGAAFWLVWDDKEKKVKDQLVAIGDWGDKADATHKQIEEAIDKGEEKKTIKVTLDEYAGTKIWVLEPIAQPKPAKPERPEGDDAEAEDMGDDMMDEGSNEPPKPAFEKLVYARSGNNLLAAADVQTMESALERLGGKDGPSVGDSDEFAGVIRQLEKPQAYAVFISAPLVTLLDKLTLESKAGTPGVDESLSAEPGPLTVLSATGLSGVKGAGVGVKFDTESGMMEQSYAVLCPDKKGLLTLFSAPDQKFTAPNFVSADAASVSLFQFKFADVLSTVTESARTLPPDIGDQFVQNVQQAQLMIGPILANLGPQIWLINGYTKPYSATSGQVLGAIATKDAAQFNTALTNLQGMLPIQSRDFQGNQIWSLGTGMPIPGVGEISIGVGFGHVFIGGTSNVENAMRQAGNNDAAGLSKEKRFADGVAMLKASGLAFGWSDTRQLLEYADWQMKNIDKVTEAQLGAAFGDDPDAEQYKKEMIEEAKKNQPAWARELPTDVVARELGDTVWDFHATAEGFQGRSILLRPAPK